MTGSWSRPPLRLIAHRGGAREAPENTVAAVLLAARLGADAVEIDVRRSADGELVACHDATVDRTTGGSGAVARHTLEELRALDAAYWFVPGAGAVPDGAAARRGDAGPGPAPDHPLRASGCTVPTLGEVLAACPDTPLVIEVKEDDAGAADALAAVVEAHGGRGRVLVASFHDEPLALARARGLATSASARELETWWAALAAGADPPAPPAGVAALQVPLRHEDAAAAIPQLLHAARRWRLPLHVWTVDDIAEARRLDAAGVDGILTDRPGALAHLR